MTITQSTVFITAVKSFMLLDLGEGCESEREREMGRGMDVRGMRERRERVGEERWGKEEREREIR
jgi:hypothetical protein